MISPSKFTKAYEKQEKINFSNGQKRAHKWEKRIKQKEEGHVYYSAMTEGEKAERDRLLKEAQEGADFKEELKREFDKIAKTSAVSEFGAFAREFGYQD